MMDPEVRQEFDKVNAKLDLLVDRAAAAENLASRYAERTDSQERRITALERKWWWGMSGVITALTAILAFGAKTFVDFFTGPR